MSKPAANDVDFDARLQQMNCGGMTKHVRGDTAMVRRWLRDSE